MAGKPSGVKMGMPFSQTKALKIPTFFLSRA
jgi:hypothetical protein